MDTGKIVKKSNKIQKVIEQNSNELFGQMRSLTSEEQLSVIDYLESISTPTDINFNDLLD